MPTHKQLPHKALACTRYHRQARERNQQKTKMVKHYDRNKNRTTKRLGRTKKETIRLATPKTQPNHGHNPKNPRHLLERTTRSRENIKTSSTGTQNKPRLPEQNPEQERHLLERTIMNGRYEYDIQNRLIKKDGNYLARLTDKEAHKLIDELNRQDRKLNEYERTIAKIRKILRS